MLMPSILIASLLMTQGPVAESVHLQQVTCEPAVVQPNLVKNPSFEQATGDDVPDGWIWSQGPTNATCRADSESHRSGRHSIHITNGTAFGANVYGGLAQATPAILKAGHPYTLSAWVRSEAPGVAWMGGGSGWQFRMSLPATGKKWQRVSMTFTPGEADTRFQLRINTDSPTAGFWVDDVKLEEGVEATPFVLEGEASSDVALDTGAGSYVIQGDGPFHLVLDALCVSETVGELQVTLDGAAPLRSHVTLPAGCSRIDVIGTAQAVSDRPRSMTARFVPASGKPAELAAPVAFYSATNAEARCIRLRARIPAWRAALIAVKARRQDVSYPLVPLTVIDNFTRYAVEDARHGEVRRALEQVADMEAMAARLDAQIAAAKAGRIRLPNAIRWVASERPVIRGGSFLGHVTQNRRALPGLRPIFFNGYGHFSQVQSDMEKWPSYGANAIQVEVGPSAIFPSEGVTLEAPIRQMQALLDRAKKAGVGVCLLISPHYMPDWFLTKHPDMRVHRDGFLPYCLHAPEGQEFLREFVRTLITPLKDYPALHSVCLSNEPMNVEDPCAPGTSLWHEWLAKRHSTIDVLNARWHTSYRSFEEVPAPDLRAGQTGVAGLDAVRWNQEFFAGWHRMLADAVHSVAPNLPVHAKAMTWTFLGGSEARFGVDAYLFGKLSQINGNDSVCWYGFGQGEFAQEWQGNAMAYDLQRSVLHAPVFNTENHIILDRDTRVVPAEHVRTALWQQAIHGQGASAIWVWERTFDPKSDFSGSIMHRPACAEAVGIVNYDLNRVAPEVTALQSAAPQVLLLHSTSGLVWDSFRCTDCADKLYTALTFCGLRVGFVTERQLEDGVVPKAGVVLVPNVTHLSQAARSALASYRGRIVLVGGDGVLTRDEYDGEAAAPTGADRLVYAYGKTTWRELLTELRQILPTWGVAPDVAVTDAEGQPIWGVEWRCARMGGKLLVNVCNRQSQAVQVRVGAGTRWRDVLTGALVRGPITLKPMEFRLLARLTGK